MPPDPTRRPRLLIADDNVIFAESVRRLLEKDFAVAASIADGAEIVRAVETHRPDVLILDLAMPHVGGIQAARMLRSTECCPKIVFLTQESGRQYVDEAMRAGASAYVVKQAAVTELAAAVRAAAEGHTYVSRAIQPSGAQANARSAQQSTAMLTPRQRDILRLLGEGKSAEEIASALFISVKTVEFHSAAIGDELGLADDGELRQFARRHASS